MHLPKKKKFQKTLDVGENCIKVSAKSLCASSESPSCRWTCTIGNDQPEIVQTSFWTVSIYYLKRYQKSLDNTQPGP